LFCKFNEIGKKEEPSWKLVRRVAPGNKWHKSTDKLRGTEENYGTDRGKTGAESFSIKFDTLEFEIFRFATGDEEIWLEASKF
jgi:hypothetical protein